MSLVENRQWHKEHSDFGFPSALVWAPFLRNDMRRIGIGLSLLIVLAAGCTKGTASDSPQRVLYYQWSGTSAGGEFTFTSLAAFELDIEHGQIRRLSISRKEPDPMLSAGEAEIQEIIESKPWAKLNGDQRTAFREALDRWLRTNPPEGYLEEHALGREDGYVEVLTVFFTKGKRVTKIDPRGNTYTRQPPGEWKALITFGLGINSSPPDLLEKRR